MTKDYRWNGTDSLFILHFSGMGRTKKFHLFDARTDRALCGARRRKWLEGTGGRDLCAQCAKVHNELKKEVAT